jgi:8-oxo-dGTP diphosphatase
MIQAVAVLIKAGPIYAGEKILAVTRKGTESDWGLPGGKVEPNETPEEAANRECMEEVGVRVFDLKLVYEGPSLDSSTCWVKTYEALSWGNWPRAVEPNTRVSWITWAKMLDLKNSFVAYNMKLYEYLKVKSVA